MAKKPESHMFRDFLGILALAFTLFALLALVTYSPNDPSFNQTSSTKSSVANYGGVIGAYLAGGMVQVFGTGAFVLPLTTFILAWAMIRRKQFHNLPVIFASGALLLISLGILHSSLQQTLRADAGRCIRRQCGSAFRAGLVFRHGWAPQSYNLF